MANHNELIKAYTEYVALLEKELAADSISQEDIAKGKELVAQIATLKASGE